MQQNWDLALSETLKIEGGYVNDPQDSGGPTDKGITQRVFDAYRATQHQPEEWIKRITPAEVSNIYKIQYAQAIKFDEIPSGLDYTLFDEAVNSGPHQAIVTLQEVLGVKVDGKLGVMTMEALLKADKGKIIKAYATNRLGFLSRLRSFKRFGKGWTKRVRAVEALSLKLNGG